MDTKTQLTNTDTQDELTSVAFQKLILSEVEGWAGLRGQGLVDAG